LRLSCDLNRRPPSCGSRVRVAAHSGHSTSATPLSRKHLREIWTTPENVHLVDVVGGNAAFFRDRACSICTVGAAGGFSGWAGGEETCSASVPLACACPVDAAGGASTLGPAPSMIRSVSRTPHLCALIYSPIRESPGVTKRTNWATWSLRARNSPIRRSTVCLSLSAVSIRATSSASSTGFVRKSSAPT
jgi:hypothetical protein